MTCAYMFRNTFIPRDDPSFIRQVGGWESHPELKRFLDASEISMKMHFRKPRVSYFDPDKNYIKKCLEIILHLLFVIWNLGLHY